MQCAVKIRQAAAALKFDEYQCFPSHASPVLLVPLTPSLAVSVAGV